MKKHFEKFVNKNWPLTIDVFEKEIKLIHPFFDQTKPMTDSPAAIRRLSTSPASPGSSDRGGISENISILTPAPPDTTTLNIDNSIIISSFNKIDPFLKEYIFCVLNNHFIPLQNPCFPTERT